MNDRPLVLVTVGTDFHKFDRLIGWVDRWVRDTGTDRVRCVVQHGASAAPEHAEARDMLDHAELLRLMGEAAVVVTHAGAATIGEARRLGRLPVIVAREPELDEIVDGHQIDFARRVAAKGLIELCDDEAALRARLDRVLADPAAFRLAAGDDAAAQAEAVRRTGELIDTLVAASRGEAAAPADVRGAAPEDEAWPSVTVVIATRNRPELLRTALDSVLAQDYPGDVRCLVVFDQSDPDKELESGDDHRGVRVIVNERAPGLAGARNTGILAADGDLVAFCDDDDVWLPGKLRAQAELLRADPAAELVCCGIQVAYDDTVVDRALDRTAVTFAELLRSRVTELHPSTFVLRRAALVNGIGLVSEEVPGSYGEDYEFLLRAARRAPVRNVPEVHVRVLWHKKSYFAQRWRTIAEALDWLLERYPEFRFVPPATGGSRGRSRSPRPRPGGGGPRCAGRAARCAPTGGSRAPIWRWPSPGGR
ncbi:glycosyltransferase [Thermomonospora amylolytica]|uniref:glycosyltransferase n=1 Tax=Thermomonospora amylolytica TaxID=1411117 RepID=UPI002D793849|nr:glycosyltransferase [Thermomonospora amylolytica]